LGGDNSFCTKSYSRIQVIASAVWRKQCAPSHSTKLSMRINEIVNKPAKPLTPEKARIESLKQQKERASDALRAERDRQKITKAQKQIGKALTPHL